MRRRIAIPLGLGAMLAMLGAAGTGIPPARENVTVIVTAAPVYEPLAALRGGERFPRGAELLLVRAGKMTPLAPGMAASADASVSFDGKTVLFAGKKTPGDRWALWTMAADGGTPQLVLTAATDLIRPLWMPDGRMVYGRRTAQGFALETAALDGSGTRRLSYLPGNFVPDDLLRDGRVLFESGYPLGEGTTAEMYLVYADGSGVESVRCDHGRARAHGREIEDGDIVFAEGGRLARFTSAQADAVGVAAPAGEYAGDVGQLPDGAWLVAVRRPGVRHFALAAWTPGARTMTVVAQDAGRDLVEPVVVAARATPKRHPSGLHPWTTGNLLALDARSSRSRDLKVAPATVRVETRNANGQALTLGTAPVYGDGSFFVQAPGDVPLRFVLLDAAGRTVRQEQGWFWVRRGEQRICVGCHTGPERAPDNRLPEVLVHTTTPVAVLGEASGARGK